LACSHSNGTATSPSFNCAPEAAAAADETGPGAPATSPWGSAEDGSAAATAPGASAVSFTGVGVGLRELRFCCSKASDSFNWLKLKNL
jgi:hypothetical protein